MNSELARQTILALAGKGVSEFCICAGARNAPLVKILGQSHNIQLWRFFEERSAAFFALGRSKVTGRPTAVVTTSGTAAAELLPATIEAHYSGLPLVLVTADRPRNYRGTASPQTIEQVGLFSHYVSHTFDLSGEDRVNLKDWAGSSSIHINLCFDEPLLDQQVEGLELKPAKPEAVAEKRASSSLALVPAAVADFVSRSSRPVLLLGELSLSEQKALASLIGDLGIPVYVEALSGLRGHEVLRAVCLSSGERILQTDLAMGQVDGVIRVGRVPTLRFWRDLEGELGHLPVLNFSDLPFSGLSRVKERALSLSYLSALKRVLRAWDFSELKKLDETQRAALDGALERWPLSECGWIQHLSRLLPQSTTVFLGNSLPIREWDLAASQQCRPLSVLGNRGANGIDGLVSTFFATCDELSSNVALIGDLTALYDLSGPWILPQLKAEHISLVVINNGGGKIFSRVFQDADFENNHSLQFGDWAKMWSLPYALLKAKSDLSEELFRGRRILEIVPDEQQTLAFWKFHDELWQKI